MSSEVRLRTEPVSLAELWAVVGGARVSLEPALRPHLQRSVDCLEHLLRRGEAVYGVTTGFGGSVETHVSEAERAALALNLVRFHGCGTGACFSEEETRAILVARIASLIRGYSAVRFEVVERLIELLNRRILPRIPSEGSVGASGDLTPLSYVAAALLGEREVWCDGRVQSAAEAFAAAGVEPLSLRPKESLALMNGTSVMTGLACIAHRRALALCRWAALLTAACCDASAGQPAHFDARLFELKPHPGQSAAARWVREDLAARSSRAASLQDRYSLRCAPHVIGVALDQLRQQRSLLETELNGVNDNPLIDPESERVLHGGHFYGGHVCQAMDSLKTCVANLADLLDRQLLLLTDPATSRGLPANLVAPSAGAAQHGFKAMQIATSALTAEACKLAMPASVFSRSTENHNQDKVSLGTIAARDCLRSLELTECVAAIHTLAVVQAADLRGVEALGPGTRRLHARVREEITMNVADRAMDDEIRRVVAWHRAGTLPLGAVDFE